MPRETKATRLELDLRLKLVMNMILDGVESSERIKEILIGFYKEKRGQELKLSTRQVENYIAKCFDKLRKSAEESDKNAYQLLLARNLEIYRLAKNAGEYSSANMSLREIAKLQDAYKQKIDPEEIEMKIVEIVVRKSEA